MIEPHVYAVEVVWNLMFMQWNLTFMITVRQCVSTKITSIIDQNFSENILRITLSDMYKLKCFTYCQEKSSHDRTDQGRLSLPSLEIVHEVRQEDPEAAQETVHHSITEEGHRNNHPTVTVVYGCRDARLRSG